MSTVTENNQPLPCPDHREYDLSLPSSLTQFGIAAMQWWESLPKAEIDMGVFRWHTGGTCFACCGGAARCAVEGWTPENFLIPPEYGESGDLAAEYLRKVNDMELILDSIRSGRLGEAFEGLDLPVGKSKDYIRRITSYHESPELFYRDMQQLSDDLKAGGY